MIKMSRKNVTQRRGRKEISSTVSNHERNIELIAPTAVRRLLHFLISSLFSQLRSFHLIAKILLSNGSAYDADNLTKHLRKSKICQGKMSNGLHLTPYYAVSVEQLVSIQNQTTFCNIHQSYRSNSTDGSAITIFLCEE
jgi:hypothetical protein